MHPKENYPYSRSPKKYTYSRNIGQQNINPNSITKGQQMVKTQRISELQQKLRIQQQKYRQLQQTTIRQQMNVLEQISLLEQRFTQVTKQKQYYQSLYEQFDSKILEYKKIKGVSVSMIKMMEKVDGKAGDLHQAWKWIKKIVMQYQTIRNKALDWKKGYDAFMAMTSIDSQICSDQRQQTFSDCSDNLQN